MKNRVNAYCTAGLALFVGCATPPIEPITRNESPHLTITNDYFRATIHLTPEGTEHFMRYGPVEAERQLQRALDEYTGDLAAPELKLFMQDINQQRTKEKLELIRSRQPRQPDVL